MNKFFKVVGAFFVMLISMISIIAKALLGGAQEVLNKIELEADDSIVDSKDIERENTESFYKEANERHFSRNS